MDWRFWESKATRVARAAARWRVDMEEPESQAKVDEFEAWLRADPANFREYKGIDHLSWAGQKLAGDAGAANISTLRWLPPAFGLAALAFAMVVGVAWHAAPDGPAFAAIANGGTAIKTQPLGDGSVATLDTDTSIEVAATPGPPGIRLMKGRVRLAIHMNSGHRFTIETPAATIVATDCLLDVAITEGGVQLRLISGRANLSPRAVNRQATGLPLGRSIRVRNGAAAVESAVDDDPSWTLARVSFDDAPLAQILAIANPNADPKIAVAEPAIASLRLTAVLDLRDTRKLARKLAAALDLRVIDRGAHLVLSH